MKSIQERLKERFPQSEERRISEAQFSIEVGKAPRVVARDLGLQGVWLRSADDKEVAQFRVDGFTFSRLRPYRSWEDMLPKALDLWKLYVKELGPDTVSRIAVRYINHLPLPEGAVDLDDIVTTGPRIPQGVPDALGQFSSRILLSHPEFKMHATVTQSLEAGVTSAQQTLLLDIDAFKIGDFPVSAADLAPLLESLRTYKNMIFFGTLTENFMKVFE